MRKPRRNTTNASIGEEGENNHGYEVDLNDSQVQEKIMDYLLNGLPSSDARGHFIHLQFKVHPVHADILESIKQLAPKNWFRTNSDLLRSACAIGCYVTLKFLKENCSTINENFKKLEMINDFEKEKRKRELIADIQRINYEARKSSVDTDTKLKEVFDEMKQISESMKRQKYKQNVLKLNKNENKPEDE